VSVAKNVLQSRGHGVVGRAKLSTTETSPWSECGFDTDTSPQVIESFIFGDNLCSDDLGTCISCIAHLEQMIDQVRAQALDAKASPILPSSVEGRLEDCYHKTSLSEHFRFARLGFWR
jgi:hypothetical protein